MTPPARNPSTALRPVSPLLLWIVCAAVLAALPGCGKVEAGGAAARADLTRAEQRAAQKVEKATAVALPDEYRLIAPAGVDGALPPIPPSETWPAQ